MTFDKSLQAHEIKCDYNNTLLSLCEYLVVILVALIPLMWNIGGGILYFGDFHYTPYPLEEFKSTLSLFAEKSSFGSNGHPGLFFIYLLITICDLISTGNAYTYLLFFCLIQFFAMVSIRHLCHTVFGKNSIIVILAMILYAFNFYRFSISYSNIYCWAYSFLPLTISFAIQNCRSMITGNRLVYKCMLFSFLFSLTCSVISLNIGFLLITILAFSAILLYFSPKLIKIKYKVSFKRLSIALIIFFLFNSWWIYGTAMLIYDFLTNRNLVANPNTLFSSNEWIFCKSSFVNLYRTMGAWSFAEEYCHYVNFFNNPVVVLGNMLPLIFILGGIITMLRSKMYSRNTKRMTLTMFLACMLLLFFIKGLHEPFSIFMYQLYKLPFSASIREPYSKVMIYSVIILSLLYGWLSFVILEHAKKAKKRRIFTLLLISLILIPLVSHYPILTSNFGQYWKKYTAKTTIPQEWNTVHDMTNSKSRTMVLPLTTTHLYYSMNWSHTVGHHFSLILNCPIVYPGSDYLRNESALKINLNLAELLKGTAQQKAFINYARLLNIKYLLLRKETLPELINTWQPDQNIELWKNAITNHKNDLLPVFESNLLDLYEIKQPYPSVLILTKPLKAPTTNNVFASDKYIEEALKCLSDSLNNEDIGSQKMNSMVTELLPGIFNVNLSGTNGIRHLVLTTNFNKNWNYITYKNNGSKVDLLSAYFASLLSPFTSKAKQSSPYCKLFNMWNTNNLSKQNNLLIFCYPEIVYLLLLAIMIGFSSLLILWHILIIIKWATPCNLKISNNNSHAKK